MRCKRKTTHIRIGTNYHTLLSQLAKLEGRTMMYYVHRALNIYFKRKKAYLDKLETFPKGDK